MATSLNLGQLTAKQLNSELKVDQVVRALVGPSDIVRRRTRMQLLSDLMRDRRRPQRKADILMQYCTWML